MSRPLLATVLLCLTAASCGGVRHGADAGTEEHCSCGEGETCVVEFGGDGYYEDMPWSCFPRPAVCSDERYSLEDCVGALACGGRPWSYLDGWSWSGGTVFCFAAGTRPCPIFDAGFRSSFGFCQENEFCVDTPQSGECSARCLPVPRECAESPTCECVGERFCDIDDVSRQCFDRWGPCSSSRLSCSW